MLQISYTSRVVAPLGTAGYRQLVEQAQARNAGDGITGLLLYDEKRFVQAFEGPDDAADACFARIRQDARHTDLHLVQRCTVDRREFGGFAMAALTAQDDVAAFVEGVKAQVQDVASTHLQALFIGFAVLGRGRVPA